MDKKLRRVKLCKQFCCRAHTPKKSQRFSISGRYDSIDNSDDSNDSDDSDGADDSDDFDASDDSDDSDDFHSQLS